MTGKVRTVLVLAVVGAAAAVGFAVHAQMHMAPPPQAEVPGGRTSTVMDDFGGRPVVEVTINGKGPYAFILDTGASVTVVDAALSQELQLPAAGVHANSMGDGPAPQTVNIGELRLGEASLRGLLAAAMPLGGFFREQNAPRGVLSASVLPGYLVTLDYPGKRISLEKGELPGADEQTIFEYPGGDLPTLPIQVAGHETRIHMDSGSPFGLVLPTKFLTQLPLASAPREVGKARTPGGEFPISAAPVSGEIKIGKYKIVLEEVRFSDVSPGPVPPTGNVGFDVLRHFVVTLDSRNRRIRLAQ